MRLALVSCLCALLAGCGSRAPEAPAASAASLDLAAFKALKPSDPAGAAVFQAAIKELEGPDNTGTTGRDAIGELAFRVSTIPALCAILEGGDDRQLRQAFFGLRAVVQGVASAGWSQKQGPDFKLEEYKKTALPVLAQPKHLAQIRAGLARLAPPSQAAFRPVVDEIK